MEKTIEQMKDYIIHHSIALNRTFTCEGAKKAGQLIAHTGAVYFIEENSEAKNHICSFGVSDDMTKIECNRLAKSFVNAFLSCSVSITSTSGNFLFNSFTTSM